MKKEYLPILLVHVLIVLFYTVFFLVKGNYEFIIYIIVIALLTALIFFSSKVFRYSKGLLWGLVIWSFLHLSGGGIQVGDGTLYQWMVLPLFENYPILRFDQVVHAFGFGVATFLVYELLQPFIQVKVKSSVALSIIIVMAALGLGALNEIIEFFATLVTPEHGVGDYVNNSLDMVFNLIGILIALVYLRHREA